MTRIQVALRQCAQKGSKGCIHCSRKRDREKDAARRARVNQQRIDDFNEWLKALKGMPVTPLSFRKGFDSERQRQSFPAMFICRNIS